MPRFKGEPQELPDYLVQGLQILADQTDEQPWPTPHMAKLLRAMARGCAIRDGKKGYFEITTRTFHLGMVSRLLGKVVDDVKEAWLERTGQTLPVYWDTSKGKTEKRKSVFKYQRSVPVTVESNVLFDADEFADLLRAAIHQQLALYEEQDGEDSGSAGGAGHEPRRIIPWTEDDLVLDVLLLESGVGASYYYYRELKFCEVKIAICKRRVMQKLGFPIHMAD